MYPFLLVLLTVFVLLAGLSFLAIRRRNEILRIYLTPEAQDLEEKEFFRRIPRKPKETEVPMTKIEETGAEKNPADGVQWGTGVESN